MCLWLPERDLFLVKSSYIGYLKGKEASIFLMCSINLRKGLFPCCVWVNCSVCTIYWSRESFQVLQCPLSFRFINVPWTNNAQNLSEKGGELVVASMDIFGRLGSTEENKSRKRVVV